jgi:hypothetical protein
MGTNVVSFECINAASIIGVYQGSPGETTEQLMESATWKGKYCLSELPDQ